MWRVNSVEFCPKIALKDLPAQQPEQIFEGWIDRIDTYYLSGAKAMDTVQNGFASMTLQLCALDALGTLLMTNADTEDRIRDFCKKAINENSKHGLKEDEIEKASRHLYFQYRCGLVHNGFTVQVGRYSKNNEPDHVFLMSYETPNAVIINLIGGTQKAFIINPSLFRENLGSMIVQIKRKTSVADKKSAADKILRSLAGEIAIAKIM